MMEIIVQGIVLYFFLNGDVLFKIFSVFDDFDLKEGYDILSLVKIAKKR